MIKKINLILSLLLYLNSCLYGQMQDYLIKTEAGIADLRQMPPKIYRINNSPSINTYIADKHGNLSLYIIQDTIFDAANRIILILPKERTNLHPLLVPKPENDSVYFCFMTIYINTSILQPVYIEIDLKNKSSTFYKLNTIEITINNQFIAYERKFCLFDIDKNSYYIINYWSHKSEYFYYLFVVTKDGIKKVNKKTNLRIKPYVSNSLDLTNILSGIDFDLSRLFYTTFNTETLQTTNEIDISNCNIRLLAPDGSKLFGFYDNEILQYEINKNQILKTNHIFHFPSMLSNLNYNCLPNGCCFIDLTYIDKNSNMVFEKYEIVNPNASYPISFLRKTEYHFFSYANNTFHNPHPTITLDNYCLGRTRLAYKGIKVKSVEWKIKDEPWVLGDTIYYDFKTDGDQMLQLRVSYLNNTVELSNQYFFLGKSPDSQPVLQASNFKTDICVNSPQIYLAKGEKTSLFTWSAGEGASIATSASGDTATVSWNAAGRTTLKLTECSFMGCPGKSVEQGINVQARPQLSVPAALCAFEDGTKIPIQINGGTAPWTLKYWYDKQLQTSMFETGFSTLQTTNQNTESQLIFQSINDSFGCTDLQLPKTINIHPYIEPIALKNVFTLSVSKNCYADTLRAKQIKIYSVEQAKANLTYHWQTNAGELKCLDKNCSSVSIQTTEKSGAYWAKVSATATNTCTSDTTLLKLEIQTLEIENISVPNVFTPNGDGVNDVFKFDVPSSISYQLNIYNRWGQMVFEGTEKSDFWDGKFQENKCAVSSYFYVLKLVSGSEIKLMKGFIALE